MVLRWHNSYGWRVSTCLHIVKFEGHLSGFFVVNDPILAMAVLKYAFNPASLNLRQHERREKIAHYRHKGVDPGLIFMDDY